MAGASRRRCERDRVNHSEIVSFLWGVADLIRDTQSCFRNPRAGRGRHDGYK